MKTIYTAIICCLASLPMALTAQETALADTIINIENVNKVVLTESPAGITLHVDGTTDDPEMKTLYQRDYGKDVTIKTRQTQRRMLAIACDNGGKSRNFIVGGGMIHFGFCGLLNAPFGMRPEPGKSFEIGVDELLTYMRQFNDHNDLAIGMGINWRNYRMTGNWTYTITDYGYMGISPYPEGTDGRFSRLKMFSLTFPIAYYYKGNLSGTNSQYTIRAAVNLNWNSHASLRTAWRETDGRDAQFSTNSIGQNKFTVDFTLGFGLQHIGGIYMRYSPMNMFASGRGPACQSVSAGLWLCY